MYSYGDRKRAVELYIKYGLSAAGVIHELGYPTRSALRNWYKDYLEHGEVREAAHEPRFYSADEKRRAVDHHLEHGRRLARTVRALGYPGKQASAEWVDDLAPGQRGISPPPAVQFTYEQEAGAAVALATRKASAEEVASSLGTSRASIYSWKYELLGKEVPCKMPDRPRGNASDVADLEARVAELGGQVGKLEPRKAILEGTVELLGKDPSAGPNRLTNREKTLMIQALRPDWPPNVLLAEVGLARSSYQCQVAALSRPDKYAELRVRIAGIFHESDSRYGYRRIHLKLRKKKAVVSEKVVGATMKEEGLVAKGRGRKRRYGSCQGEVSEAPENLAERDFHADAPNELRLTDITESRIPAGKVYPSPIVGCFDGMAVSWRMSTSPNTELANSMLEAACSALGAGEHPRIHSDRGRRYRWPGWIKICDGSSLERPMSKRGCSPDNSACGGFFGRLENEAFYGEDWSGWTIEGFMAEIGACIRWYNERRIKLTLDGMSPVEYRGSLGLMAA